MSSRSQPLVSVVTPVYNGERYLAECIESVLRQTYQNWEYVIVNNCSTDRSLEIAQHYARQDARIRIHNNEEFLGLKPNWNHALRQISPESKYCKVVHADDWLFPGCITKMVKLAEAYPSVGLVGSYVLMGDQVCCDGLPYPSTVVPGREICRLSLLRSFYVFGSPTSLLIRADLIRDRETFYNGSNLQVLDQDACYDALQNTDFGFVHQVLTYTRMHDESQTASSERFNRLILGLLTLLVKYGPIYLSEEEYAQRLDRRLRGYYSFLGESVWQRREKAFWDYHKEGLASLGFPLSRRKLLVESMRALYTAFIHSLVHPKVTLQNIIFRSKKNNSQQKEVKANQATKHTGTAHIKANVIDGGFRDVTNDSQG